MKTQTLTTIAKRADAAARADWAPYVERAVRAAVAVAVAVYVAGVCCGAAVHALNDWLAPRFARVVLTCDVAGRGAVAPTVHPLEAMRAELTALSAKELRRLAGVRSKRHTKAALAEMVLCMA